MKNYYIYSVRYLGIFSLMLLIMTYGLKVQAQDATIDNAPEEIAVQDNSPVIMTSSADPCPAPKSALAETPNDLKLIQEDITRFTLCLQRAQLLDRLNDLAEQNLGDIQTNLDTKIKNNFGDMLQATTFDNMPFPDISSMPTDELVETAMISEPIPEPVIDVQDWLVSDITGKGSALTAKLRDENGNIVYITTGQTLPNSKTKVKSITMTDVTITDNGVEKILSWDNASAGANNNVQ